MNNKGVLEYFTWGVYLLIIFIIFLSASIILTFVIEDEQKIIKKSDSLYFNDVINEWNRAYSDFGNTNYDDVNAYLSKAYINSDIDMSKKMQDNIFYEYENEINIDNIKNEFNNYFSAIDFNYTLIVNVPDFSAIAKNKNINERKRSVLFCFILESENFRCSPFVKQSYLNGVENIIYSKTVKHYVLFENDPIEYEVIYEIIEKKS
ncbi:hypothetical protein HOK68_03070 [Candidatus Woesearchaeota archaeon]|jgi:hypothetical protein|nr:hypothetical protein [Candidatus Woesearchaeota archaeon]MBT4387275.1 hypothetical protein [Candidatus Woesearchaeota archaeon]MBT4595414.1 hypothetical protein [Candidatus Woesearchaeota archaeon]MBT5741129.1 hypothetical protein [Candidatus Woesearchaeota archaeon]MBT6505735.1 hypothetical protein [Candidatus Woesearchaeota archaeon]